MPTALILSQFAYAKMPLTLPLEVFVDGKPAVGGTPLRKRPHLVSRDVNSPHHGRPLVKIVCDCDRYGDIIIMNILIIIMLMLT
jgi:hypothetical protein